MSDYSIVRAGRTERCGDVDNCGYSIPELTVVTGANCGIGWHTVRGGERRCHFRRVKADPTEPEYCSLEKGRWVGRPMGGDAVCTLQLVSIDFVLARGCGMRYDPSLRQLLML